MNVNQIKYVFTLRYVQWKIFNLKLLQEMNIQTTEMNLKIKVTLYCNVIDSILLNIKIIFFLHIILLYHIHINDNNMLNCIHHTFNHSFMKIYNKIYFYIRHHVTKYVSIHVKNIRVRAKKNFMYFSLQQSVNNINKWI